MTRNLVGPLDGSLLLKAYKVLDEKGQKVISHDTGEWCKFEEKLSLGFKNDMINLVNFNVSSGRFENSHFNELRLSIAYKVSAKKVQKSYLSWHWRAIETWKTHVLFEKWHEKFDGF